MSIGARSALAHRMVCAKGKDINYSVQYAAHQPKGMPPCSGQARLHLGSGGGVGPAGGGIGQPASPGDRRQPGGRPLSSSRVSGWWTFSGKNQLQAGRFLSFWGHLRWHTWGPPGTHSLPGARWSAGEPRAGAAAEIPARAAGGEMGPYNKNPHAVPPRADRPLPAPEPAEPREC